MLYKQFVARSYNGCITAPFSDYINNPVYQELIDEDGYDGVRSDERLYLDLRASAGYTTEMEKLERNDSKLNLTTQLRDAVTKKLRLRIWAYSLGEYLYVLSRQGLMLRHKTYSIIQEDDDFLEWENKQCGVVFGTKVANEKDVDKREVFADRYIGSSYIRNIWWRRHKIFVWW